MRFLTRALGTLLYALFVRFPLWLINATVGETLRRTIRVVDRLVRRYAPWAVGLGVLLALHATGNLGPLVRTAEPFLPLALAAILLVVGFRILIRGFLRPFKKGGKK